MIILLGIIILLIVIFEVFVSKKLDLKKMDIDDILDRYDSVIKNILNEIVEDVDYTNINNEEELYCFIIDKCADNLEMFLMNEDLSEIEAKSLEDKDKVKEYISGFLMEIDINIDMIYKRRMYRNIADNHENSDFCTEKVPDNTKTDDSTVDITNELNSIFFE